MKKLIFIALSFTIFIFQLFSNVKITCSQKWKEHQTCHKAYYDLCYVNDLEQSEYVYYNLTKEETVDNCKRLDLFKEDPTIILKSAKPSDYVKSGYDRGHLANCDDFKFDKNAMLDTFYMSNMSPQLPGFNRAGAWRKSEMLGEVYANVYGNVDIITGPVILSTNLTIGKSTKIVVPQGFFKIFYNKDANLLEAYIMYQSDNGRDLDSYKVDVSKIEDLTGLKFEFL